MKQKGLLATLGILAIAALLVSPIMGHAAGKRMSIGTASIGGAYYPVGTDIPRGSGALPDLPRVQNGSNRRPHTAGHLELPKACPLDRFRAFGLSL
jgi:hypothetical protein